MDYTCEYCSATYWKEEKYKTKCCHKGTIKIPPLTSYPHQLKNLLWSDDQFRKNIRYYNNLFSFASFDARTIQNTNKKGIYNLKIQGTVYHNTPTTLIPKQGQNPHYGQFYIYDVSDVVQMRADSSSNVTKNYVELLTKQINKQNPYAKRYKSLYEIYKNDENTNYRLTFLRKNGIHKYCYNEPVTGECAAIIVSKNEMPLDYDLCLYPKTMNSNSITCTTLSKLSHHVDPMVFPILFPSGDLGWSFGYTKHDTTSNYTKNIENVEKSYKKKTKIKRLSKYNKITALQYYSHRLSYRPNIFNPLLIAGRLTQQFFIHAYVIVENNRMNFFRLNQNKLRIESYQGLVDHISNSASNDPQNYTKNKVGNLHILPSTYIGSPRYMQQHYQDAMAIIRNVGRPDLFITMTANPNWKELKDLLTKFPKNTTVNDIPGIVVKLFHAKFSAFLEDIVEHKIFGKIVAYIYTIEFQKRGLPHVHLVCKLHPEDALDTIDKIDKHISAEIPTDDKRLQFLVLKYMVHGPHNNHSPCVLKNSIICKKKFPKPFCNNTVIEHNGYPRYRRRNNSSQGLTYLKDNIKNNSSVDNSMVIAYNKFLLEKYECHINVEYCASIQSIKYIFSYLHKGHDRAFCKIKKEDDDVKDEISNYIDGRYISAIEAAWRLQEYPICGRSHSVIRLPVHTEHHQFIVFEENRIAEAIKNDKTALTAWFDLNKTDPFAKQIKYINIPQYYIFKTGTKTWERRIQNQTYKTIGRLYNVSPKDGERFFLKLILNHKKGCISFKELRTHENITYDTYKETAIAMNLIHDDKHIWNIFSEACDIMFPNKLREFFSYFLISENFMGEEIWNKYKHFFSQDFKDNCENSALLDIERILNIENFSCKNFGLPEPNHNIPNIIVENIELQLQEYSRIFKLLHIQLTRKQKLIFDEILSGDHKYFFIDGPGGSGKTFLYKAIIYYFLSLSKNVISMAWTGIASVLLPRGMTTHRTFRLPLDLSKIEISFLKLESDKNMLKNADLIVWDEASMIPKKALEIIDNTLQDLCNNTLPFGNKLIVLGGDFRQILPVIPLSFKDIIITETIKYSRLWSNFKIFHLTENIRSINQEFSNLLLKIGNGDIDKFEIPDNWKCTDVCNKIFSNINNNFNDSSRTKVILACHNNDVDKLNYKILQFINQPLKIYYSSDFATHKGIDQTEDELHLNYPIEYLNSINAGLPLHKLELKIGAIVMLLRNISIANGLCNGIRMKILNLHKYNIQAQVLTGSQSGKIFYIPRITLNTGETSSYPFILYRKQFPIKLAFAMTINKSQGQTFDEIGLYIEKPLFSHGQLYVALSRCKNPENIFIENHSEDKNYIPNIVWKEIFN